MKNYFTLLCAFAIPLIALTQEKALNNAVKSGKNSNNNMYFVEFKKYYDMEDVSRWMLNNGYTIAQSNTAEFAVFGDTKYGYEKIYFMTNSDYAILKENLDRIEAEVRKRQQSVSVDWLELILKVATVGTAGFLIYNGVKYAVKNGVLSNTTANAQASRISNSVYSKTEQTECFKTYYKKSCGVSGEDQCYVEIYVNNIKIKSEVSIFECLQSSKKYEFYYDYNDKHYRIDQVTLLDKNYDESINILRNKWCECE
jgi:hypothetical protein